MSKKKEIKAQSCQINPLKMFYCASSAILNLLLRNPNPLYPPFEPLLQTNKKPNLTIIDFLLL